MGGAGVGIGAGVRVEVVNGMEIDVEGAEVLVGADVGAGTERNLVAEGPGIPQRSL